MKKKTNEFVVSEETVEALANILGTFTSDQQLIDNVKELARQKREYEIKAAEAAAVHAGGRTIQVKVDDCGQMVVPVTVNIPEAYVCSMKARASANNITLDKYVSIIFADGIENGWFD